MKFSFAALFLLVGLTVPVQSFSKETKDIEFRFNSADPVIFSHDFHLKKYNSNCKVCHNAIFDLRKHRHYSMAEMEKTKSCGGCHTGVKAFSVADERYCTRCHTGRARLVVYKVKGASEATFSHEVHFKATGGKCKTCHGKLITGKERGTTMAQMEKGRTCGACHNGKTAFTVVGNCGNCHKAMKPKEITFKAKGFASAVFSHDKHLTKYTCSNCHTGIFQFKAGARHYTMADMEKGKSCGTCHDGKTAFASSGDCSRCHKAFKPRDIFFKTDLGGATFSHQIHLSMYKCGDCHTKLFPFAAGVKHYTMEEMETGKSCGGCHDGKTAFSTKEDCNKCHNLK